MYIPKILTKLRLRNFSQDLQLLSQYQIKYFAIIFKIEILNEIDTELIDEPDDFHTSFEQPSPVFSNHAQLFPPCSYTLLPPP